MHCMWFFFLSFKEAEISVREAKMSMDARGNLRGRCQKPACYCDTFVRQGTKLRCDYCDYTPGDHELITGASASDSASGNASFSVSKSEWTPATPGEPDDHAMDKVVTRMGDVTVCEFIPGHLVCPRLSKFKLLLNGKLK